MQKLYVYGGSNIECDFVNNYGMMKTYKRKENVDKILEAVSKMEDYQIIFKEENLVVQNTRSFICFEHYKTLLDNKIVNKFYQEKKKQIKKAKNKRRTIGGVAVLTLGLSVFAICQLSKKHNQKEENLPEVVQVLEPVEEELTLQTDSSIKEEPVIDTKEVNLEYEDLSETEKAITAKENYQEIIDNYATTYGLDSELMMAIATQERGIHSSEIDSTAIGLMQIEYNVWNNQPISAYNFVAKEQETFIVQGDLLSDLDYNVKVACMIFQTCLKQMNYNLLASLQCYNFGYGNMMKTLNAYANDNNMTVEEVLANNEDASWIEYLSMVNQGDPDYIEHVLNWIGEDFTYNIVKEDGTEVSLNVEQKKRMV